MENGEISIAFTKVFSISTTVSACFSLCSSGVLFLRGDLRVSQRLVVPHLISKTFGISTLLQQHLKSLPSLKLAAKALNIGRVPQKEIVSFAFATIFEWRTVSFASFK